MSKMKRHHLTNSILPGIILVLISLTYSCEKKTAAKEVPIDGYNNTNCFGIMPLPAKIEWGKGICRIDHSFDISMDVPEGSRSEKAVQRFIIRLDERTMLFLSHEPATQKGSLHIICNRTGKLSPGEDESYQLHISPDAIELSAETDLGVLYGLETLLQLVRSDEKGFYFPGLVIDDQPRFTWRGLMIDVSRHFITLEKIKQNIDAMAAVKMNVLHLHLSDDQGFRIETSSCPKLYQMGSDGLYFTKVQMKDLIAYADERGIRIVPEFDMPGHTTSWFPGYPELAVFPGDYEIERGFGIFDCVIDPTKEGTYKLLDRFITEMCELFPDEYFHIGGDENNGIQWDSSATITAFKKEHGIADNHELQAYFNERINKILLRNGKKMVGWEEIANEKLKGDIIVHSWRSEKSLSNAIRGGYKAILSRGYYIDLIYPASDHYLVDPIPNDSLLTPEEKARVLGGEATMWSEYVTMENIDSRIWPRTAAIAERFWSPEDIRDVDDMYRRLDKISIELEWLGITHISNQEMMMRRLMRSKDISSLRPIVNLVEPMHGYTRKGDFLEHNGFKMNQFSPYTRLMDVAGPDARSARIFRQTVARYLESRDAKDRDYLNNQLLFWLANDEKLQLAIENLPNLKDVSAHSSNLVTISEIAIDAISFIDSGKKPSEGWLEKSREKIELATVPQGQTKLMITDVVGQLVTAAENKPGNE